MLLNYAAAKRAFDDQKHEKDLASWAGSKLMGLVEENTFKKAQEAMGGDD